MRSEPAIVSAVPGGSEVQPEPASVANAAAPPAQPLELSATVLERNARGVQDGGSGRGTGERPGEASSAFGSAIAAESPPAPPPPPPGARGRGHAQLTASAHGRQGSREEKQRRQQSSTAAAKAASTNRLAPCAVGSVQVRWLGGSSNQSRSLAHPSPPSPTPRQTSRVLCRRAGVSARGPSEHSGAPLCSRASEAGRVCVLPLPSTPALTGSLLRWPDGPCSA